jgi:hypothetical protein
MLRLAALMPAGFGLPNSTPATLSEADIFKSPWDVSSRSFAGEESALGIPGDRDRSFRRIVTDDSGLS